MLFGAAETMGLKPTWLAPNRAFAVSVNGRERYVNSARSSLNTHTASSLATHKYVTRQILERNGLPNIPYLRPKTEEEALGFLARYHKIIVKPVDGQGSVDIRIVTKPSELGDVRYPRYIFEQYIAGEEMRYLILEGKVIAVHRSDYGVSVEADRYLERVSFSSADWDAKLEAMAIKIGKVMDLRFAAVDFLIDSAGRAYVLEVNTNPGLKWFHAPSSGPAVDVAQRFLKAMVQDMEGDGDV